MESPISDITHYDMDQEGTFRPDDRKKFQSPEWKERVIRLFRSSPFPITLHLVNGTPDMKVKVTTKYAIDRIDVLDVKNYVGIQSKEKAEAILGKPIDTNGTITAIMLQNEGSARVGMTPWMVAHRIAHMFFERNQRDANYEILSRAREVNYIVNNLFSFMDRNLRVDIDDAEGRIAHFAKLLSSFRSAQTGNLRDSGEYLTELMAEFLIKGRIIFKRDWIDGDPEPETKFSKVERAIIDAAMKSRDGGSIDNYLLRVTKGHRPLNPIFTAMKGDPLRPRTRKELMAIIQHMVDNDRLVEPTPKTEGARIHGYITEYEKRINDEMSRMMEYAIGKVIML